MVLAVIKKIEAQLPDICAGLEIPAKYIETAYFKGQYALHRIVVGVGEVHENSAHNIYFNDETGAFISSEYVNWE